jgi:hypothetical protein
MRTLTIEPAATARLTAYVDAADVARRGRWPWSVADGVDATAIAVALASLKMGRLEGLGGATLGAP